MHGLATSNRALPPRLSRRGSVLGARIGVFVGWQIVAVAAVIALVSRGAMSWAFSSMAVTGCCLTVLRWKDRWCYEWLVIAWSYRKKGPARRPPRIEVCPARLRSGAEAGIAHDESGFCAVIAVAAPRGGQPVIELPAAALASLIDPLDAMISAVQLVLHADLAATSPSALGSAYQNLGYRQVPRSQSVWLALRHDPAVSACAAGSAGSARDVQASLLRGLAGRTTRALEMLTRNSLKGQVLDVLGARDLLITTEPAAPRCWGTWHSSGLAHVTYWVRRWPFGGVHALQNALCEIAARSVTTAVLVTAAEAGRFGLTATVRVTTGTDADRHAVERAVRAAANSCGARLTRLDGEHLVGVLATAPLGRSPASHWLGWRTGGTHMCVPAAVLPITAGGVVIGPQAGGRQDGSAVAIPCFMADGATRTTIVGDPLLHRLVGLRALGSGARLQIVTTVPDPWLKLRNQARQASRMTIVRPGTQPPQDGTREDPWVIIDDTGSPAVAGSRPWLAVVTALGESGDPGAILPGQDTIVGQRSSRLIAASAAAALDLPAAAARSLEAVPDGLVAVARPGAVRFARLVPDQAERSILVSSMRTG